MDHQKQLGFMASPENNAQFGPSILLSRKNECRKSKGLTGGSEGKLSTTNSISNEGSSMVDKSQDSLRIIKGKEVADLESINQGIMNSRTNEENMLNTFSHDLDDSSYNFTRLLMDIEDPGFDSIPWGKPDVFAEPGRVDSIPWGNPDIFAEPQESESYVISSGTNSFPFSVATPDLLKM